MMMLLAAGSCVVGVEVYFGAGGSDNVERVDQPSLVVLRHEPADHREGLVAAPPHEHLYLRLAHGRLRLLLLVVELHLVPLGEDSVPRVLQVAGKDRGRELGGAVARRAVLRGDHRTVVLRRLVHLPQRAHHLCHHVARRLGRVDVDRVRRLSPALGPEVHYVLRRVWLVRVDGLHHPLRRQRLLRLAQRLELVQPLPLLVGERRPRKHLLLQGPLLFQLRLPATVGRHEHQVEARATPLRRRRRAQANHLVRLLDAVVARQPRDIALEAILVPLDEADPVLLAQVSRKSRRLCLLQLRRVRRRKKAHRDLKAVALCRPVPVGAVKRLHNGGDHLAWRQRRRRLEVRDWHRSVTSHAHASCA
mmetsp:Transcript_5493/g.18260  ORF Transcript_5493/g.18260 Transcript_5493/m.18260 type:complete len:362 (+) Transcript_5493:168-1253(+)